MNLGSNGAAKKAALALACCALLAACSSQAPPPPMPAPDPSVPAATASEPASVPVGEVTREEIEAGFDGRWATAFRHAQPDGGATGRMMGAPEGAEVTVFFGTWCGDSRREVTRFWRALDISEREAPFTTRLIAVDRSKSEPADLVEGAHLLYVPTFIVRRDGREVGRIVESAPNGIEADLASLLDGSATGVLTDSRPELVDTSQPDR